MNPQSKKPSPAEPVSELRHVKIVEVGEPLVDFLKACPQLALDRARFNYKRETMIRESVAAMLCEAASRLRRSGVDLKIVEGWRPPLIQQRMYRWSWNRFKAMHPDWSDLKVTRLANQFTAPMNQRVPPPHTTGGAVDVSMVRGSEPLDMLSPYGPRDHRGFGASAPDLSEEARANRALLAEAFDGLGITNYPSEFWHWSYGDQGWAYRGGHPHALFGPVTPDGWEPDPSHLSEEPLVFHEE